MIVQNYQLQQTLQKLPIFQFKQNILNAIQTNDVTVICGQTGCGKTTQVPKYIIQANKNARVIVTQPRRIAAISVATRVSQQLNSKVGDKVGYHIGMDNKSHQKTKITFVTDGIFLQKLTNDQAFLSSYTHFVFDEIHERGIQCDFCLIAIKLFLSKSKNTKIKIVLMSATLNSKMFSQYFSKDKFGNFIRAKFIQSVYYQDEPYQKKNRGGRNQTQKKAVTKYISKLDIKPDDQPAQCIVLPTIRKYNISIFYIEDIDRQEFGTSSIPQQIQPNFDSESLFELGINLIKKYQYEGDILIFVPGMKQIKIFAQKIRNSSMDVLAIELHSHLAGGIYQQLFKKQKMNKVIISTNMAQSSITLPDCKIVIDYCMSKQMYYDQKKNFQKLQLCWASKASIIQRAGRVGRVSDGIVFRIITQDFFKRLPQYDYPQIKRSPLEKVILKIKKMQLMNNKSINHKGAIFSDPYQVLSNAFQPPNLSEINQAIKKLIQQEALNIQNIQDQPEFPQMFYNGNNLQITRLGEFISEMPCDMKITKMLLLSIELGCFDQMIDISGIFHYKKPFFVPYDKRKYKQDFVHQITTYDQGDFNDFKIKQRIFSDWVYQFFVPWKKMNVKRYQSLKKLQEIYDDDQNYYEVINGKVIDHGRLLNDFNKIPIKQNEIAWCTRKSLYSKNLREILLARQNFKMRFLKGRSEYRQLQLNREQKEIAIDICLFLGFKGYIIDIQLDRYQKIDVRNYQQMGLNPKKTICLSRYSKNLLQYKDFIKPLNPKNLRFQQKFGLYIQSEWRILTKLSYAYKKKQEGNEQNSEFFNSLIKNQSDYPYRFTAKDIKTGSQVTIDNESINKVLYYRKDYLGYLVSNQYFTNNNMTVRVSNTFYINSTETCLMTLIFFNNVKLVYHKSNQFFSSIKIQNYRRKMQLPFYLNQKLLLQIIKIKMIIRDMYKISNNKPDKSLIERFTDLFLRQYQLLPKSQQWQKLFDKNYLKYSNQKQVFFSDVVSQKIFNVSLDYYKNYRNWKNQKLKQLNKYDSYRYQKCALLCKECYPKKIIEVFDLDSIDEKQRLFTKGFFHEWVQENQKIYCREKHLIGQSVENQKIKLVNDCKLILRYPSFRCVDFKFQKLNLPQILELQQAQRSDILYQRSNQKNIKCYICYKEDEDIQVFANWELFRKHMNQDKYHKTRLSLFKQNLRQI